MKKKEITEKLKSIANNKHRWKLFTFNSHKPLPRGCRFFVDHCIISKKYIITIEVKLGKDTLSVGQIETNEILSENNDININNRHYILTDDNAEFIFAELESL